MTEETTNDTEVTVEIQNAFHSGIAANKEEEEIKLDMIEAGAKFKNVTRLYNQFAVDAGLIITKKEKIEIVNTVLDGLDLSVKEVFDGAVAELVEKIKDTSEKAAASLIRAFGKKNELEVYKAVKKSGGGTRTSFTKDFYDVLLNNPKLTKEEVHDYIAANGSANTLRWESTWQKVRQLANDIANKYDL